MLKKKKILHREKQRRWTFTHDDEVRSCLSESLRWIFFQKSDLTNIFLIGRIIGNLGCAGTTDPSDENCSTCSFPPSTPNSKTLGQKLESASDHDDVEVIVTCVRKSTYYSMRNLHVFHVYSDPMFVSSTTTSRWEGPRDGRHLGPIHDAPCGGQPSRIRTHPRTASVVH